MVSLELKHPTISPINMHDYMHNIIEDYVDDLLAKSKIREEHLEVLIKIFDRLLEHNVRLNLKKCVFGVTSVKLLGLLC